MAESPQYTKTGVQERPNGGGRSWGEWFSMWSNRLSFIPGMGYVTMVAGIVGTGLETLGQILKGNYGSAVATAASGAAATLTNTIAASNPFTAVWYANVISGVATGSTIGTHARKGAEVVIGAGSRMLGKEPEVLRSHMAGIGSLDNDYAQSMRGPGYWASRRAGEMGRDPREMYNAYRKGAGADHVAQLDAARANGPAAVGM